MKMRSWRKRLCWGRAGRTVTCLWSREGVSLASWESGSTGLPGKQNIRLLKAADCSPQSLTSVRESIVPSCAGERIRQVWLVLGDSSPSGSPDVAGSWSLDRFLPEWVRGLAEGLGGDLLPRRVYSVLDCLEAALTDWPDFREPGRGFGLSLGNRFLFLAWSERGVFRRDSRVSSALDPTTGLPSEEWLQQTQALFLNRTGQRLGKICLPGADERLLQVSRGIELVGLPKPPHWPETAAAGGSESAWFLHWTGLRHDRAGGSSLGIPSLERRKRFIGRNRTLRLASLLLLAGWGFILLGACRHRAGQDAIPGLAERWNEESRRWHDLDKQWSGREDLLKTVEAPYRLVGMVCRTAPGQVQLSRIQVERDPARPDRPLRLHLEGGYSGEGASGAFRRWVNRLKSANLVSRVENLRFEPDQNGVQFALSAMGESGGPGI